MTLIEVFLKNKRVQKTLSTKPGEEGFSLIELVVVIAVLAILSAVAIQGVFWSKLCYRGLAENEPKPTFIYF